ncbi:hypothetical protein HON22_05500 [Candidatus Peregrinibacteria bacterium]|jgi:hypothetical protein|nr:hypothetical protein [Candidatus Peregrinibacteria bacterium]
MKNTTTKFLAFSLAFILLTGTSLISFAADLPAEGKWGDAIRVHESTKHVGIGIDPHTTAQLNVGGTVIADDFQRRDGASLGSGGGGGGGVAGITSKNGNIGIGTTSPSDMLTVSSKENGAIIRLDNSASADNHAWRLLSNDPSGLFAIRDETKATNRLVIDTNGNVGIGTIIPGAKLEVSGEGGTVAANGDKEGDYARLLIKTTKEGTVSPGIEFDNIDNAGKVSLITPRDGTAFSFEYNDKGKEVANHLLIIKDNGNVGIGKKLLVGSIGSDYVPDGQNFNYNLRLDSEGTSSIGFHDSAHSMSSIRYKEGRFTIGADDGWGTPSVVFPGSIHAGRHIDSFDDTYGLMLNHSSNKPVHIGNIFTNGGKLAVHGSIETERHIDSFDGTYGLMLNHSSNKPVHVGALNSTSGRLNVHGGISFNGQKACRITIGENYSDSMIVPSTWSKETCSNYAKSMGGSNHHLECIFANSYTRSGNHGVNPPSGCGW